MALDEIEAERLAIQQEIDALREHTDIAQEWLASGAADGLSVETMEALEGVVSACDVGLDNIAYQIKFLDAKISNMKFRLA